MVMPVPLRSGRAGRLAVTKEGLKARDHLVFESCARAGIPVAVTMGGGDMGEAMQGKVRSSQIAGARNLALLKGHNPDVAQAFVDPEFETVIDPAVVATVRLPRALSPRRPDTLPFRRSSLSSKKEASM